MDDGYKINLFIIKYIINKEKKQTNVLKYLKNIQKNLGKRLICTDERKGENYEQNPLQSYEDLV